MVTTSKYGPAPELIRTQTSVNKVCKKMSGHLTFIELVVSYPMSV